MPIFPPTRCPDCGTTGTGRICPACRFALWRAAVHFKTEEGREGLVYPDEGYEVFYGGGKAAILEKPTEDNPEAPNRIVPVVLVDGGNAWLRWDGHVLKHDQELEPAHGLPVEGTKGGPSARKPPEVGQQWTGTEHGLLGWLEWTTTYPGKLEKLAAQGAITLEPIENTKLITLTVLRPEVAYNRQVKAPARPRKKPEKSRNLPKKP